MVRERAEDVVAQACPIDAAVLIHDQSLHGAAVVGITLVVLDTEKNLDRGADVLDKLCRRNSCQVGTLLHQLRICQVLDLSRRSHLDIEVEEL